MDSRSDSPERYIRILSPPNLLCRYSGMVTICRRGQERWFPHPVPTSPSLRRCGIPRAGFRGCSWDWGRSTYPRGDVDWDEDPGQCQQCVRRLLGRKHTALSHSPHLSQPQPPPPSHTFVSPSGPKQEVQACKITVETTQHPANGTLPLSALHLQKHPTATSSCAVVLL